MAAGIKEIREMVVTGKAKKIEAAVKEALDAGVDAKAILNEALIGAMDEVGAKFTAGELFVPEMLVSAKAMKKGVEILKPKLGDGAAAGALGKVVIATVAGDLHDIGKNIVAMMLETSGFEVINLGVDVAPEKFVQAVKDNPDTKIVACSALLTTTMMAIRDTVEAFEKEGDLRKKIKIMIGGAPITQEICDEYKADAYTVDAAACVAKAKELVA